MVTRKQAQDAYDAGAPVMTDSEFDKRFGENSGYLGKAGKVIHNVPMLSQQKCHTVEDIKKFLDKMMKKGENKFSASLKLDGFACSLEYVNGSLHRASTRGDGMSGDDITEAIRAYVRPPENIKCSRNIEIRGEVILPVSELSGDTEENYRNIAVGMCKRKVITESNVRLKFYAYDVLGDVVDSMDDTCRFKFIEELGIDVVPHKFFMGNMRHCYDVIVGMEKMREDFDGVCDGIVFRCVSKTMKLRLGETSHHPKYSIAYKFDTKAVESVVRNIEITTGETGKRTPVAMIEPVVIDGATVSRVSIGSEAVMEKLGIKPGSRVLVKRSGGVIPKIVEVLL